MDLLSRLPVLHPVLLTAALGLACAEPPALGGVVEDKVSQEGRVLIASDPGVAGAPSESAWMVVSDPGLLEALVPGQRVAYRLRKGTPRPEVASLTVLGWATEEEGWIEVPGNRRIRAQRAAEVRLEDQDGRRVNLADWRGGLVLLDFIYTRCPGPCPAQTHDLVSVQRGLSDFARSRTRFASVTLEPEVDDGPTLRAYAEAHGADLSDWSFLGGEPELALAVARNWGIGSTPEPDGSIGHTLHSFLIDDRGYVVARYSSRDRDPETIRAEIEDFARVAGARSSARPDGSPQ